MELSNTTEVTHVQLVLTKEEAQKLQALLGAVPVNTTDGFFDVLANGLIEQLQGDTLYYEADENGEYGPPNFGSGGCGCATVSDEQFSTIMDEALQETSDELSSEGHL